MFSFIYLLLIIILSFVNHIKLSKKIIYLLLLLICMTRPAGASIIYIFFRLFILKFKYPEINKYFVGSLIVFSLIYYAPYFLSEINSLNFFNNSK